MKNVKIILGWAALAVLLLFTVLNWTYVRINIVFVASVEMPLSLVILGSAVLGAGAAVAFRVIKRNAPKP